MKKNAGMQTPLKVGLISLGCAKNLVDAEIMLGSLMKGGVEITNDSASADVVIVNTCSFIDSAQEESVDAILESTVVREANNRGQGLVVSGCLPQRFREELPKLLPEVDAFMGIDQVASVTEIVRDAHERRQRKILEPRKSSASKTKSRGAINASLAADAKGGHVAASLHEESLRGTEKFGNTKVVLQPLAAPMVDVHARPTYIPDFQTPRFRLTPRHFAYLKIAEGCNHPCSFCIIPRMRGAHRSRAQMDIVSEARALIADGVKELNLISQDSTYYGMDLRPAGTGSVAAPDRFRSVAKNLPVENPTLCTLLRQLNDLPGEFWIRLLYTHPAHWTDDLIQTIAECPKVARYVDMPLQHIHDNMLERMRRETSSKYISDLIQKIRAGVPDIAIRTTFIVGFPGEKEEYFQQLLDCVAATRFERLGVFTYSKEEATRASAMAGHIPDKIKKQRRERVMAGQQKISREISAAFVGRTLRVLIEKAAAQNDLKAAQVTSWEQGLLRVENADAKIPTGRYWVARGQADAPDIDGRVYVRCRSNPPNGGRLGEFADVRIIGHTDYDLIAELK